MAAVIDIVGGRSRKKVCCFCILIAGGLRSSARQACLLLLFHMHRSDNSNTIVRIAGAPKKIAISTTLPTGEVVSLILISGTALNVIR